MSTIERLAECATQDSIDLHIASMTQFRQDLHQTAIEYAAVVAERDAMVVRNGELERLLLVAACPENCIDGAYHGHDGEPVQCQFCYARNAALTQGEEGK